VSGDPTVDAPRLLVEVEDRCARLTLNRPDRLNALDARTFRELDACLDHLAARDDVAVVVLTGAGRAFCAGADLRSITEEIDADDPHAVRAYLRFVGTVVRKLVTLEVPTIAAVNGPAIGGGCNLALACDLVVAREDAVLSQVYTQRALVPDMGGTYFLPRLVGRAKAFELAYFGDPVTAADAATMGLINLCVPAGEFTQTVDEWAARLAGGARRALGLVKTGLLASPQLDLDAALEWEANAIALSFATDDLREAFAAFNEKRPPRYVGH
jgi:2-(1,2-epoxy-1,2-dihydrophenyl)acetyl-CoA isomerase